MGRPVRASDGPLPVCARDGPDVGTEASRVTGGNAGAACFTCNRRYLIGWLGDALGDDWMREHEGHEFVVWELGASVVNADGDLVNRISGNVMRAGVGALPATNLYASVAA